MAANPALVRLAHGELVPAPFPGELLALARPGVLFELDEVETASGRRAPAAAAPCCSLRRLFTPPPPPPPVAPLSPLPLSSLP